MKKLIFTFFLCLLAAVQSAWGYDFSYTYEGDMLYYNVLSTDKTAEVTSYDSYNNNYYVSGAVEIPLIVTNGGVTYSVTSIGFSAFYGCSGLTSVTIPTSVTSIGDDAFWGCSGLTSVAIPNSVKSIGWEAFGSCSGLTEIDVSASHVKYQSIDGILYNKVDDILICCPGGKKGSVTIPNSVTSIGNFAFEGCSGLTSLTIPNSVTSIGNYAFVGCSGLTSLTIPNSVTSIGGWAFEGCSGLTSVTIPNSVTSIGFGAFHGCSGLTSVTIPASVTSIGGAAFEYCSGLTSVTIPNSVTSIGEGAFYDCSGLTSVTIPNSVTSIEGRAFDGCVSLTSVTIPASVTSIGDYAFEGCSGLTNINVSASNANYQSIDGILYNKTGDTLICCPGGKKGSVTIPNSVISIGDWAFGDCSGLTSVTIPNSVTSIGEGAFAGCSSLTSVTIPASVTSIGGAAFEYCSGLTSVTIPNSVTSIGDYAFYRDSSLTSVTVKAMTPPTFSGHNQFSVYDTLRVPKESVDLYKSTSPWSKFKTIIGVDFSDVPTIKADANLYVAGTELQNRNNEQVTVYNAMGKVVLRSDAAVISLEALPHGVYVVATSRGNMKVVR